MSDNIEVIVKESGTQSVIASFDELSAAATRAHKSVGTLQKTFGNVGRSTAAANRVTALGNAAAGATGHVTNLNTAMTALNNTRVTSNLNSANQALGQTGQQATRAATGVRDLLAAFISFQAIKGVIASLIEAQVAMQQIHFGLMAATGSAERAAVQMDYLRQNAQILGLDLRTSAQEYTRLAASADAMNVSMEDQQKLYTGLSRASTVLHLDAQKVQFATLALTQMFSKGKIQAEELRRQLGEAIPGVVPRFMKGVQEVTKGTDLAKYSFEDLMKRGLLNTKQFLPQLVAALEETGRGWEEASQGLNAEINRLKTAWFELKVEVTEGLFTTVLIGAVRFLSQNLKELTGTVIGLGVAISVALAPAAILKFTGYVQALGAAVWAAAGPWGILAGVLVGVTAYLVTMRDEIKLSADSFGTLGDAASVVWSDLKGYVEDFWHYVKDIPGFIAEEFLKSLSLWTTGTTAGLSMMGEQYAGYFEDITSGNDSTWLKVLKVTARTIDAIIGLFMAMGGAVLSIFAELGKTIGLTLANSVSGIKALISGDLEGALAIGKNSQSLITNLFSNLGKAAGEGWDGAFRLAADHGLEQYINGVQKRSDALGEQRNRKKLMEGMVWNDGSAPPEDIAATGVGGGKKGKSKNNNNELDKLGDALRRLIGEISPTEAAMKKLAEAQEILNNVAAKGTPEMKALVEQMGGAERIMGLLKEKYKDALDPVGALNDKYDRELATLKAITPQQKATAVAQEVMNKARKDGYDATMQAALGEAAYRRELEKTQEQLIASAESQIYQNSAGQKAQGATAQVQGLVNQRNAGNIGPGQFGQGMSEAFGLDPTIMDKYAAEQEQYAAHLQAMEALKLEYYALAAESDGIQQANYIAAAQATNETIGQLEVARAQNTLSLLSGVFGQVATLMGSHNKKLFKIGQAAAIAQAVVQTASAVLKAGADWGYPWAIPFQAIAIALGAAQISQIRSQQPPQFRTGGSMVVGGSGGIDSQLVQFNATPGEHVSINTPAEARAMQDIRDSLANREERGNIQMNLTVVQQGRADNTTPEQNARAMRKQAERMGVV